MVVTKRSQSLLLPLSFDGYYVDRLLTVFRCL